MIVMALDHANGLVARAKNAPEMWAFQFPDYHGDALAFLTRFVTHLAAPGFFFLMGAGMSLFTASRLEIGWKQTRIVRFFALRGLLLVVFQFLLENPAWALGRSGPPEDVTYVGVLFALGSGMIIGSLFVFISQTWLIALSSGLVVLNELALPVSAGSIGQYPALRTLLHLPGFAEIPGGGIWVLYPLLPWLGIVGLGVAFGRWLEEDRNAALRATGWIGLAGLAGFMVLRFAGGVGNIRPPAGDTWIDFFNLVKYPPSITFLSFTLGVNLLLLRLFTRLEGIMPKILALIAIFGRAPLFFYILHLYFYAALGLLIAPQGLPLLKMYPYWLLGLVVLYPLCLYFGRFKSSRPVESPWRLL